MLCHFIVILLSFYGGIIMLFHHFILRQKSIYKGPDRSASMAFHRPWQLCFGMSLTRRQLKASLFRRDIARISCDQLSKSMKHLKNDIKAYENT